MAVPDSSRSATFATNLATVALVLAAAVAIGLVATGILGSIRGGRDVAVHQEVALEAVPTLPQTVLRPQLVDVTIKIDDAGPNQLLLATVRDLGPVVLAIALLWLVRGLLQSVRHGDPFTPKNVQRLRGVGFVLLVGFPIVSVVGSLLQQALARTTPSGELGTAFSVPAGGPLAGLGVFILAEVFAHGVRLREDLEGTV